MTHARITLPADRPGPGNAGRILIDAYGIAHLYADTETDLFFLQGFNAARDRLWQIDLWYKRGLGRLAANFGEAFLAHDMAARKILYRGDLAKEWAAYGPDAKALFGAFVDGVNAFIALTRSGEQKLPAEFAETKTIPDFWTADEAITIRFHGLMQNVENEVARARLRAHGDAACERFLGPLQPQVADTSEFSIAEADLLDAAYLVYCKAVDPLSFGTAESGSAVDPGGSNAWAISGARTQSGKPILASDPHRALTTPSLRYIVGLHAPGLDLIGGGEPMQPGVSIGHNGTAAFGLTIFPADQEDLVLLDMEAGDVQVSTHSEAIQVRGQSEPVEIDLDLTPVGPVLAWNEQKTRAVALQSVWFTPGAFPYLQSLRYRKAQSLAEFSAAAAHWGCPAVNLIYADRAGDIARLSTGFIPRRPHNGLLPQRGMADAKWEGVTSVALRTRVANPASGYVHTANEFNVPDDLAREQVIGFEWTESSRARRIKAQLDGSGVVTPADALALQLDKKSLIAERVTAYAGKLALSRPETKQALARLSAWDAVLDPDSRDAALFEVWYVRHLKPALVAHAAGTAFVMPHISNEALCDYLESLDAGERSVVTLIEATIGAALAELAGHDARLGKKALWGDLHHALFAHPLASRSDRFPIVGPLRQGGSESTVFHSGFDAENFAKLTGSTFRVVIDLADLDKSVCINAPGQSGDIASPFYDAMAPLWAAGEVVPLFASADAVRAAAKIEIEVVPAA